MLSITFFRALVNTKPPPDRLRFCARIMSFCFFLPFRLFAGVLLQKLFRHRKTIFAGNVITAAICPSLRATSSRRRGTILQKSGVLAQRIAVICKVCGKTTSEKPPHGGFSRCSDRIQDFSNHPNRNDQIVAIECRKVLSQTKNCPRPSFKR